MPRQKRFDVAGVTQHIIQRGNNRSDIFRDRCDRESFKVFLGAALAEQGVSLHAYVLMTNHVHLLATPSEVGGVGRAIQSLGRRYVRYFNTRHGRSGTLWEGRYRASAIDTEQYLLCCYRYIELNPVRAGMVNHPGLYPWSSFWSNAYGWPDDLVTAHPIFDQLGGTSSDRRFAYRRLFANTISDQTIELLRERTNKNWALGDQGFCSRLEMLSDRQALPRCRGGDRKSKQFKTRRINRV